MATPTPLSETDINPSGSPLDVPPKQPVQVLLATDGAGTREFSEHLPREWVFNRCSIAELFERLHAPEFPTLDMLVVDAPGASALPIAKRVADSSEITQALFLLAEKDLATFRWAIALNPALGSPLAIEADLSEASIATTLRETYAAARYDQAMRAAVDGINRAVEIRNEIALAKIQRQRASDRYLANLLAQIPDPIVSTDLSGAVISWNDAAASVFRTGIDAAIGRPFANFFDTSTAGRMSTLFETIGARSEPLHDELTLPGRAEHYDVRFTRTVNAEGHPEGVLIIMRDITALRVAQDKLRAQARELERSNADLEQFAYIAAHDLKEPLRTVGSYSQLLVRRFREAAGPDAEEFAEYITRGVHRMNGLLDDLLDYSRIGANRAKFAPVNIERVLDQVVENLRSAIEESGAQIVWTTLPTVSVDFGQLVRVFQNLVSNAIKFRREVPLQIQITATHGGERWLFTVQDNGIGVERDYFEYIFLAFKRLHTQNSHPGSGVGLAICKKIIEGHGGKIWVDSVPGEGSTFSFTLPAAHA